MALNRYVYRYSAAHSQFLTPFYASLQKFRVPDIVGTVGFNSQATTADGAFAMLSTGSTYVGGEINPSLNKNVKFTASLSHAAYKSSETVQMSSLRLMAIIKS